MSTATSSSYNLRSLFAMGHLYARTNRSGASYAERFAAGLKQAWAEEKAEAARKAARMARFDTNARLAAQLNDLERERLERMAGRTVTYSFQRGTVTGRMQGGRW